MKRRDGKPGLQPVSRILEGVLRDCGLQERLEERAALSEWSEIVGGDIAGHTRAVDLVNGVLTLEADHGAWRQEVTMLVPLIISKFNARYGEGTVTDIQWRDRPRRGRKPGRTP
jgi:predicted nucleic acid-binding Zn ribbon protein